MMGLDTLLIRAAQTLAIIVWVVCTYQGFVHDNWPWPFK